MSDPYSNVKGGKLRLKGGSGSKTIEKKRKKKKSKKEDEVVGDESTIRQGEEEVENSGGEVYTIDAAKRMKYEELFPVETKRFGYEGKKKEFKSVEDALDDRVKKKADRYCK